MGNNKSKGSVDKISTPKRGKVTDEIIKPDTNGKTTDEKIITDEKTKEETAEDTTNATMKDGKISKTLSEEEKVKDIFPNHENGKESESEEADDSKTESKIKGEDQKKDRDATNEDQEKTPVKSEEEGKDAKTEEVKTEVTKVETPVEEQVEDKEDDTEEDPTNAEKSASIQNEADDSKTKGGEGEDLKEEKDATATTTIEEQEKKSEKKMETETKTEDAKVEPPAEEQVEDKKDDTEEAVTKVEATNDHADAIMEDAEKSTSSIKNEAEDSKTKEWVGEYQDDKKDATATTAIVEQEKSSEKREKETKAEEIKTDDTKKEIPFEEPAKVTDSMEDIKRKINVMIEKEKAEQVEAILKNIDLNSTKGKCGFCQEPNPAKKCSKSHSRCKGILFCNKNCDINSHRKQKEEEENQKKLTTEELEATENVSLSREMSIAAKAEKAKKKKAKKAASKAKNKLGQDLTKQKVGYSDYE